MSLRFALILLVLGLMGSATARSQECANRCVTFSLISSEPDRYSSYYWNLTNRCTRTVRLCGCSAGSNCDSAGCYHQVPPGQTKRVTTNRSAQPGETVLVYISYDDEAKPTRGADHQAWMRRYDQTCGGLARYKVQ